MFGFRSASSTLAAQWSILRFVVQPSYRSSFASLRFAARSPSSQRAGDDPAASSEVGTVHIDPFGVLAARSEVAQLRPIYFVLLHTECASVFRY